MFKHISKDLPASLVVFFVALPLCLGIALASGAPLFSGLIAGIIGGIVVGSISGSQLGVSGPAAGLAVIVLAAIASLGFENFLVAVVIGGILQIIMGALKAGVIGYFFPSSVIKGMLAGIGIIIFLKQIPHAFGYDKDYEGDLNFFQSDGQNTFTELINMLDYISPGALVVTGVSLLILLLWEFILTKKHKIFTVIPGPLVAVVFGVIYQILMNDNEALRISTEHLVQVPVPESASDFLGQFTFPNFAAITNYEVWVTGVTIAIVASLETLLCVEASDKMDPHKRETPTNRELFAQGTGNMLSGLIGGLPVTQVIVRSSANVQSGGQTKLSTILHGIFLLVSIITIPTLLNMIPLAVLAAILLLVGYKLAKPSLFKEMYSLGKPQFFPFIATIIGIVFTDLLIGIGLGLAVGIITILLYSYKNSHFLHKETSADEKSFKMTLAEEVTFLNKGAISRELHSLPKNAYLEIDVRKTRSLDFDIIEILDEFKIRAAEKNINITLLSERGTIKNPESYREFFKRKVRPELALDR
ncbi:SulP family inorganic anion transporter [Mesonia sp. K7]|uniref:SulP family inorganic anion transporter n=1 Tax=Mesonia sp. K7 TaxID=2218606 RepID=UPI000DA955F8|nr:SulP family inorganic anion transporter [Mesonia sp. K7]PZD79028.1 SulP family inorganic anion transporter [Mesonia sp. K7]